MATDVVSSKRHATTLLFRQFTNTVKQLSSFRLAFFMQHVEVLNRRVTGITIQSCIHRETSVANFYGLWLLQNELMANWLTKLKQLAVGSW